MKAQELIDLSISYFEQIAEMTHRLTTGNVSHQGATIRAYARSAAENLEIELKDISSSEYEYELIRLSKIWFRQIERTAARLTSGNVSHSGSGLRGFALRCRESLIKHMSDEE
jgi:hypothetical protein